MVRFAFNSRAVGIEQWRATALALAHERAVLRLMQQPDETLDAEDGEATSVIADAGRITQFARREHGVPVDNPITLTVY